jgi:hypothetical protein
MTNFITRKQVPKMPKSAKPIRPGQGLGTGDAATIAYDAMVRGYQCRWRYLGKKLVLFIRYNKNWRLKKLEPQKDIWLTKEKY